ncbi:MAG: hypothetical protein PHE21_02820 [Candidatus Dojkabacteria bacterium]|nr:hypothetical protein [Candidatus Dojkabacteria bacterium]
MKYIIEKHINNNISRKYKVDFLVKAFNKLSRKDEEKIYRIVRIIDSLGEDSVGETTDKDYKFQTDNDKGIDIYDGIVTDYTNKESNKDIDKTENHSKNIRK